MLTDDHTHMAVCNAVKMEESKMRSMNDTAGVEGESFIPCAYQIHMQALKAEARDVLSVRRRHIPQIAADIRVRRPLPQHLAHPHLIRLEVRRAERGGLHGIIVEWLGAFDVDVRIGQSSRRCAERARFWERGFRKIVLARDEHRLLEQRALHLGIRAHEHPVTVSIVIEGALVLPKHRGTVVLCALVDVCSLHETGFRNC